MAAPSSRSRIAPWALTGAALLMGAALLGAVWSTWRTVERTSETLVRGQADVLREGVRLHLGAFDAERPGESLAALLDDYAEDGLRYAALLDGRGGLIAAAGSSTAPRVVLGRGKASPLGEIEEVGDRVRVVMRRPPLRRRERAAGVAVGRALVLEFEPLAARELRDNAARTFGLGALAAGGFLLVALGLVRWFLKRQELEQRLERDRRLASLGQMSAVLAHEIKNPLASLKGNAQLLAGALPEGDKPRARADRVVAEAIRLEALTRDLLEFARTGELHRAPTDPAALVREVAAAHDAARIAIDADGAPATWSLDAGRLRQVLGNLIDNALAAGGGPVEVRVAQAGGRLAIEVRDHGPGLGDEDLAQLFEPFFTTKARGTGLGLAVAKRLVELHGGTIRAANADGGGARFHLEIP